jgi:hypothetical protein
MDASEATSVMMAELQTAANEEVWAAAAASRAVSPALSNGAGDIELDAMAAEVARRVTQARAQANGGAVEQPEEHVLSRGEYAEIMTQRAGPDDEPVTKAYAEGVSSEQAATAPEDILFGPLAVLHTPEERHLAAWEIYQELVRVIEGGRNETDLPERLLALHADNGHGYCQGCGRGDNGAFLVRVETCLTRIEMDR